jgi:hypothetical protein
MHSSNRPSKPLEKGSEGCLPPFRGKYAKSVGPLAAASLQKGDDQAALQVIRSSLSASICGLFSSIMFNWKLGIKTLE